MTRCLFITLGDPYSVNAELIAKLLSPLHSDSFSRIFVGSRACFLAQNPDQVDSWSALPTIPVSEISEAWRNVEAGNNLWIDTACREEPSAQKLSLGERKRIVQQSLLCLRKIEARPQDRIAVLTMPIDKSVSYDANFPFHGQTEFFEDLWKDRGTMLLAGPKLRVALLTNHLRLSEVAGSIDEALVFDRLKALVKGLRELFGIEAPRIAAACINPHGGDGGLFGDEDARILAPALQKAEAHFPNLTLSGPLPADTLFHRAFHGEFDAVLASYHDQGLGPLKLAHFYDAINLTVGLRHLRVSPDHGPARDRFLQGSADLRSTRGAYEACIRYLAEDP